MYDPNLIFKGLKGNIRKEQKTNSIKVAPVSRTINKKGLKIK